MNTLYDLFSKYKTKVLLYSNYWDDEKSYIDFENKELVLVNEEDEYEFHLIFKNELELSKLLLEDSDEIINENQKISDSFYYDFEYIKFDKFNNFKINYPYDIYYKERKNEYYPLFDNSNDYFYKEKDVVEFLDYKSNIKKVIDTLDNDDTSWYEFIIYNLDLTKMKSDNKDLLNKIHDIHKYFENLKIDNLKYHGLILNVYGQVKLSFSKLDSKEKLNKNEILNIINNFMSIYNEFRQYGNPFVNVIYNDGNNIERKLNIVNGIEYNEKNYL